MQLPDTTLLELQQSHIFILVFKQQSITTDMHSRATAQLAILFDAFTRKQNQLVADCTEYVLEGQQHRHAVDAGEPVRH